METAPKIDASTESPTSESTAPSSSTPPPRAPRSEKASIHHTPTQNWNSPPPTISSPKPPPSPTTTTGPYSAIVNQNVRRRVPSDSTNSRQAVAASENHSSARTPTSPYGESHRLGDASPKPPTPPVQGEPTPEKDRLVSSPNPSQQQAGAHDVVSTPDRPPSTPLNNPTITPKPVLKGEKKTTTPQPLVIDLLCDTPNNNRVLDTNVSPPDQESPSARLVATPTTKRRRKQTAAKSILAGRSLWKRSTSAPLAQSSEKENSGENDNNSPRTIVLEGLPISNFTMEQLKQMPIVYAFHLDPIQQEKTEPATPKRKRPTPKSTQTTSPHVGKFRSPPPEELEAGWPPGWKRQEVLRVGTTNKRSDKYWYSPKTNKRLRSLKEVQRFLTLLSMNGGDEDAAYAQLPNK